MEKKRVDLIPSDYVVINEISKNVLSGTTLTKNNLLRAANQILAFATQFTNHSKAINQAQLKEYLLKELAQFAKTAMEAGYDKNQILIADYALKAYLDKKFQLNKNTKEQSLRNLLDKKENTPDYFFSVLEKISKTPGQFIDVIELMYIILNLGFKGKFRPNQTDSGRLQKIIDQTYAIIRSERGDFRRQLSSPPESVNKFKIPRAFPSMWFVILLMLIAIVGIYFGFNATLGVFSKQMDQQFRMIENG
ncbi:MAG: type IVB secretion system protein IcmH/DotU [Gammaproteobacteria bacterium]|nr:type IVB secretion system protein IcmH/DotU [Gammaproteobacteria bacterium]